jgi:hypothetical protein
LSDVTCNAEFVTVTLAGVHDAEGNTLPSLEIPFGLLLGDINGDGVVDSNDSQQVKLDRGQETDGINFREDINTTGRIDAVDFALVKSQLGTMLPP